MINSRSWQSSSTWYAVVVVGLLLVAARPAAAGPNSPDDGCLTDNVCLGHYNQAVKLFEDGRFEPALGEFQAAYHRRQMPWLLINIGRTLHRLGRPREALEYYERHRLAESKPDAETIERREKYIAQARALTDAGTTTPSEPADNPTPPATPTDPAATPTPAVTPPPTTTANPAVTGAAPAQPEHKPLYKKWSFRESARRVAAACLYRAGAGSRGNAG